MTFGSTFGRVFSPTFQPKSTAAAGGGWWDLNGTITSCVAAYQPKGAASLEDSLMNLTGNTDYDLIEGTNHPVISASGWDYSTNTLNPARCLLFQNSMTFRSVIVRCYPLYSEFQGVFAKDGLDASLRMLSNTTWAWNLGGTVTLYVNGEQTNITTNATWQTVAGVGSQDVTGTMSFGMNRSILLNRAWKRYISAAAIYSTALTTQNISDLTTAMATL